MGTATIVRRSVDVDDALKPLEVGSGCLPSEVRQVPSGWRRLAGGLARNRPASASPSPAASARKPCGFASLFACCSALSLPGDMRSAITWAMSLMLSRFRSNCTPYSSFTVLRHTEEGRNFDPKTGAVRFKDQPLNYIGAGCRFERNPPVPAGPVGPVGRRRRPWLRRRWCDTTFSTMCTITASMRRARMAGLDVSLPYEIASVDASIGREAGFERRVETGGIPGVRGPPDNT